MKHPAVLLVPAFLSLFCVDAGLAQNAQQQGPLAPKASSASPEYTFVLPDSGGTGFLYPHAINNLGEVTGQRYDGPFIYKDGAVTPLLSYKYGYGSAVNDAGDVVGAAYQTQSLQAFKYSGATNGSFQYLDLGQPNITQSAATGINNLGQIVGYFLSKKSQFYQGFLYQNGTTTLLNAVPHQFPASINDFGEIAGTSGGGVFLSTHGFDLTASPPAGLNAAVTGLDSSGRVTGYLANSSNSVTYAFNYSAGVLNVIPNPSGIGRVYPGTMNDCGEFVGVYDAGPGEESAPFLYTHGAFKSLAYLLTGPPYNSFYPVAINNRGEILGEVVINGTPSTMIMVPKVPEACGTDATIVNTASSTIVGPAGQIVYTIQAKNLSAPTTQFTVSNLLGRESRLLSCEVAGSTGTCTKSANGQTVTISLPNLQKGTAATITLTVHIAGTSGDDQLVIDTARLTSSATADYLSTAYTNIKLTADLSISASLVSNDAGLLHYQATVTDLGPNNSHAALLLDPLPANTSFVSASTTAGSCSFHSTLGPNGSVRCPLGNLAHLAPATVDVVLQALPAACPSVTNTFSLTGKSIDGNSSNDSSTVVTPLSGSSCLSSITKQ